ncbi:ribosome maturation factor RimM [uncultured Limosilactobacillus sp.]|uniref:ribosome maturation factor RimM n=1 Tax=uncultured Limosilactobacillus sp. TaxID=2837629 RepID=UPI0025E3A1FC|nr:ribosome maturation factor RimM [uncultured Limosilactobacillus sp.]
MPNPNYYHVGKIVNTHGIRGEVKVVPITDFVDERFGVGSRLVIEKNDQYLPVTVASARHHKGTELVKFENLDNIDEAEKFRNCFISVSEEQQAQLEDGQYYYHQIIGLDVVTVDGRHLGKIKEIMSPGANDVWVVQRTNQRDLLLPVIKDVIKKVDLDQQMVTVKLLEGLE